MTVNQLTKENIDDVISNNDIVIIDFWAPWCGPCQSFKPIFEEASGRHEDVEFVACNTEEQQDIASMFAIQSIPTTVVFREQVAVFGQPGLMNGAILDDLLDRVRKLNMDEVRTKIAEQEAEQKKAEG
jgi:thioredoxin 1